MKRDNGDLKLFKLVGIGLALFYVFIYLGTSFVTVGLEEPKPLQQESSWAVESRLEAKEENAEILGKFWNEKGHFIVVYNELTKAPEIFQVDYSEWQYMRIGEKY